jgi:hypothetical protein
MFGVGLVFAASLNDHVDMVLTYRYRYERALAMRHGAEYIEVEERLTTQVCSACGARGGPQGREGLVVRDWICGGCGASHDRDINSPGDGNPLALARGRR